MTQPGLLGMTTTKMASASNRTRVFAPKSRASAKKLVLTSYSLTYVLIKVFLFSHRLPVQVGSEYIDGFADS